MHETSAQVGAGGVGQVVVPHATDRSIDLKHSQGNFLIVGDAVLAQGAVQLVRTCVFLGHVRGDDFAIVDEQCGLALDEAPEAAVEARCFSYKVVHHQESAGRDHAPP